MGNIFGQEEHFIKTIIVPLSNINTAPTMLELATKMVHPDNGVIMPLFIISGDIEEATDRNRGIYKLVRDFRIAQPQYNIQVVIDTSPSISRGILDVSREYHADAILLSVQGKDIDNVKLGTIVENVINTAQCNVIIYRASATNKFQRIVICNDGTAVSVTALMLGAMLGRQYAVEVSCVSIQNFEYKQLKNIGAADLFILGVSHRISDDPHVTNAINQKFINQTHGSMLMISQIAMQKGLFGLAQSLILRANPYLTDIEKSELVWNAKKNSYSHIDYIIMVLVSAALATAGLYVNQITIIIGAMLMAPVMQPLSALAIGLSVGDTRTVMRANLTLITGVIVALVVAFFTSLAMGIGTPTEAILFRTSVTVMDAVIAFIAGYITAYATSRKGLPISLAGVAIATTLMPPICVIGIGIMLQDISIVLGASALFATNAVFLIGAQVFTYHFLGLNQRERYEPGQHNVAGKAMLILVAISLIIAVALLVKFSSPITS